MTTKDIFGWAQARELHSRPFIPSYRFEINDVFIVTNLVEAANVEVGDIIYLKAEDDTTSPNMRKFEKVAGGSADYLYWLEVYPYKVPDE